MSFTWWQAGRLVHPQVRKELNAVSQSLFTFPLRKICC